MTKCAIYCRVSTAAQEDNTSLETQLADCRAYAMGRGWQIVGEFQEVQSGADYWERPRVQQALDLIRHGGVDVLLVRSLDRLSRETEHQAHALVEVERVGATIDSATENIDSSMEGSILRAVAGILAKAEREKIRQRTMRGKRERAETGHFIPGKKPPYGLLWGDDEKSHLIPDPATAPTLLRMFREIGNGGSATAMARTLTKDGIPTPSGLLTPWRQSTIVKIVRNPIYTGQAVAFRYRRWKETGDKRSGGKGKVAKIAVRPEAEQKPLPSGRAPQIITPELFARVERQLGKNQSLATRGAIAPDSFLLRGGMARCGYCGGSLTARTERRKGREGERRYYQDSPANRHVHGCPSFTISAKELDAIVEERLMMVLEDPAFYNQFIATDPSTATIAPEKADTERAIAEREKRIANLLGQLELLDGPEAVKVTNRIKTLGKERDSLQETLAGMERRDAKERDRMAEAELLYTTLAARLRAAGDHEAAERVRDIDPTSPLGMAAMEPADIYAENLTYAEKRRWLDLLGFQARVWATNHDPRWEVTSTIDPTFFEPDSGSIAITTSPWSSGAAPSGTCRSCSTRRTGSG